MRQLRTVVAVEAARNRGLFAAAVPSPWASRREGRKIAVNPAFNSSRTATWFHPRGGSYKYVNGRQRVKGSSRVMMGAAK
jgi:hypothetical protein